MVRTAWAGGDLTVVEEATGRRAASVVLPMRAPVELPVGRYRARTSGPQHRGEQRSVTISLGTTTTISTWLPLIQPLWVHPMASDGRPMLASEQGPAAPRSPACTA